MIKKIVFSFILVSMFIAIFISLTGVERVTLGREFFMFLNICSKELEDFNIEIPNIPEIPLFQNPTGFQNILNYLSQIVNGLSGIFNFIIIFLNMFLKVFMYITIILRNLITFKDSIQPYLLLSFTC